MTRVRLLLGAGFVACLVCWFFWGTISQALQGHWRTRVSTNQAHAVQQSGTDAVNTTGNVSARSEATDALTRENSNAIHNAPGASAPVDPGVRDAGLIGLCRRSVYHSDPKCLRFTVAR